ncbi:Putative mannosylglycerate hydrolase [Listeria monocytogenes]|nr:Putative mannosylglycerate hydrolase [Listeria monocytogenes]
MLQDAFLTSGEANIRNLQYGLEMAEEFGQVEKIGYFPDTFGLYGQVPQLMRQAGFDTVFSVVGSIQPALTTKFLIALLPRNIRRCFGKARTVRKY